MNDIKTIEDIKLSFPDEWVLIGNPKRDKSGFHVLSGIPIYHSKDKKEVCYIGRDKTAGYDRVTLLYTGTFKPSARKLTGKFYFTPLPAQPSPRQ